MTRRRDPEQADVKETLADDGRQVLYSSDPDTDEPADTDEWIASDTTVSGSDQQ